MEGHLLLPSAPSADADAKKGPVIGPFLRNGLLPGVPTDEVGTLDVDVGRELLGGHTEFGDDAGAFLADHPRGNVSAFLRTGEVLGRFAIGLSHFPLLVSWR